MSSDYFGLIPGWGGVGPDWGWTEGLVGAVGGEYLRSGSEPKVWGQGVGQGKGAPTAGWNAHLLIFRADLTQQLDRRPESSGSYDFLLAGRKSLRQKTLAAAAAKATQGS